MYADDCDYVPERDGNLKIGEIKHPRNGYYSIYWSPRTGCYGIAKGKIFTDIHCGYATLMAMLKQLNF